ncbi:MAG: hypothetical protein V1775_06865 [Bacteroidota bacterium]
MKTSTLIQQKSFSGFIIEKPDLITAKPGRHHVFLIVLMVVLFIGNSVSDASAQEKKSIAIISMDTKELAYDSKAITSMVQLELEKANVYEVLDRYDVSDQIKKNNIDPQASFGKNSLVETGKLLGADKMLSGSIEKFGDKLILIFRLIDVQSATIEKTSVMEYVNQQDQMQMMIRLSLNNILGIANDRMVLDLLVNFDQPITSSKTTLKLSGPRVGANITWGPAAERMGAPANEGGFNMYPVSSMIGYQFEKQYLSSGDFQALFELIPGINSLESGIVVPTITGLLGFRFNKSGLEFGLGPNLRFVKMAQGYYDEQGKWQLGDASELGFETVKELDSRGQIEVSTGMIFAIGKTFRSGYLNLPVNLYISPRKSGSTAGITVGFNVAKKPKPARQ